MRSASGLPLGKYNRVSGKMVDGLAIDMEFFCDGRLDIWTLINPRAIVLPEHPGCPC